MKQAIDETLLTSADAARLLNLTPARVRQIAAAGGLPHLRTASGTRLYKRSDVEGYARARRGGGDERDTAR
jgi:excisionase family DNA binding protein